MNAPSAAAPLRPWLLGTLAVVFLTGCASARSAERQQPSGNESVEVGYGSVDKEQVVGSVTTVAGEDEKVGRTRTLAEMLSRVPGVRVIERPGGGLSVRIRGTGSFQGGQEPLYVIDGMVMNVGDTGLGGINPNVIKSITVLKDAGETAIYGSRGANGVVIIKTKKGSG